MIDTKLRYVADHNCCQRSTVGQSHLDEMPSFEKTGKKASKSESCELCDLVQKDLEKTRLEGKTKPKLTTVGKVLLGVSGASFVALCAVTTPFLLPALRKVCLPYVPATNTQVSNVLKLLQGRSGTLIDLGSGDGRIVSSLLDQQEVQSRPDLLEARENNL